MKTHETLEPSGTGERVGAWDFFPLVMCINLREREDRYEEAREELRKAGLDRVTFVRTERQEDRDKAIVDAHMACLRHAIELGVTHFLVFEDDVLFQEGAEEGLRRSVQFMKERADWKVFYLGGFVFRKVERLGRHILRGAVLTTHAYVMRTDFARRVLEKRPYCTGMSVDLFYSALLGDEAFVHVSPLICIQRPSGSDGTWDKRSLNKEGWLGNAMIYTALDFRERLRFEKFSPVERLRVQNGIAFFKVFRWWQRRRLERAESLALRGKPVAPASEGPAVQLRERSLRNPPEAERA